MSYFQPYVDESGYHYPTYNDILEQLIDDMQTIYGSGIYLGNDSQDYEMLSKIAEKIYDTYQTVELAYNAHSPVTAIGTGLDFLVAINGISRKRATKSVATLTLTGTAGTVIEGGVVADSNGIMWDLPDTVTIGGGGTVNAQATCRDYGTIAADANTITRIMTPVYGWTAATNGSAATVGTVAETDSQLRARQADSVSLPSRSVLTSLEAALKALSDIGRCVVYENDTNSTDANSVPGHSICVVIEGADEQEIAETIFRRKGPGCGTHGSTTRTVTDEYGHTHSIKFQRLSYVDVDIEITLTKRAGWLSTIPDSIRNAIVEYLDSFTIGTDLTTSIIWMVAQTVNKDIRIPQFSITQVTAAKHGETLGTSDVEIDFNETARGRVANIDIVISE